MSVGRSRGAAILACWLAVGSDPGIAHAESIVAGGRPADSESLAAPGPDWAVGLYLNLMPDITYLLPTVALSWNRFYAEARYQYEDLDTGSLWLGGSFAGGDALTYWIAPIAGGAFGQTNGLGLGLVAELAYGRLSLSTSSEYLFDLAANDASFFYSWPEWLVQVHDRATPGITLERSLPRDLDTELNTGLTFYTSARRITASFYAFNPWDADADFYILGIGTEF